MIKRILHKKLLILADKFPVIAVVGPRQSGKTTLSQLAFPNHTYLSLEDHKIRALALEDPHSFFKMYQNEHGIILDEIQEAPALLSYIQIKADAEKKLGYFILTGSQNFLVNEAITQTLAGRIAICTLLPCSISELQEAKMLPATIEQYVFQGQYPSTYARNITMADWYPNYIRTYVERDVRTLRNVIDLSIFKTFMGLCAGRIGQLLNVSSLANDCGISEITANAWLSILEACYIILLLQPYHTNIGKRLTKSQKLYFYDTGLACSLLNIESANQLPTHYLRGGLVESMVITELHKQRYNAGFLPNFYFWRDKEGNEVDCLMVKGTELIPIEIKAGQSISTSYFDGLNYWNDLFKQDQQKSFVVYAGDENQPRAMGNVVSWRSIDDKIKTTI